MNHKSSTEGGDAIRVGLVGYGLGGSTFHAPLVSATSRFFSSKRSVDESAQLAVAAISFSWSWRSRPQTSD